MAKQTLRDVIDEAIRRAWEAGAEAALESAALAAVEQARLPVEVGESG